jgi:peptide deformylase
MILPIYLFGNPILRKKSVDIDADYPDLKQLIDDMFETMYKADGVGLAAPQIGKSINLIVINTRPLSDDEPELKDFKRVFINPKITFNLEKKTTVEEGCLSIPGIHEDVSRPTELTIEYFNENFEKVIETLKGFRAIVIQHEYDHLSGILFVDKISPIRKRLIKAKLLSITKGKMVANYKTKF